MGVLRKLDVADIAERTERSGLLRRLGAKDLVGIGVGIIIGTGIFTLTGIEARQHAGPAVVLSFAVGGVIAALAALCYAELASTVPTAGSAYTYAFATLGEIVGWIIGWDLLLEFALGAAVVSRSWSGYMRRTFDLPPTLFGESSVVNLGAVLIVLVLTVIAVLGVRQSAWFTNGMVIVKVLACLVIIGVGIFFVKAANLTPFVPPAQPGGGPASVLEQPLVQVGLGLDPVAFGIGGVLTAAAVVFFSYTGFESLANLGEETRKPSRDMPIGILGALGLCTVLYIAVSFVLTGMVNYKQIDKDAPVAAAFDTVGLSWVGVIVAVGAITGLMSVMMVELVTVGRIGFTMARDGLLPKSLGRPHPKYGTPHRMTIIGSVLIMVLAALVPLDELANMVSIGALSALLIVSLAVPVLRRRQPDLPRPFRVPFSPVLPVISALACLYLMTNLDVLTWLRFLAWLVLGLLIYVLYGRRKSILAIGAMPETGRTPEKTG